MSVPQIATLPSIFSSDLRILTVSVRSFEAFQGGRKAITAQWKGPFKPATVMPYELSDIIRMPVTKSN